MSYGDPGTSLFHARTGRHIPSQISQNSGNKSLTLFIPELKAGCELPLKLVLKPRKTRAVVRLVDNGKTKADFYVGSRLATSYHYAKKWVRPFFHPVIGPGGARVTRNWPVDRTVTGEKHDHPHHKSVWVAHGACDDMDNWSELPGHGFQRHRGFDRLVSGPVYGEMQARIDWCDKNDRTRFEETRTLRVYAVSGGVQLMDVTVSFRMTERAVTFKDTKEGGLLSVRVATSMDVANGGRIENGYGGIDERETWGKCAPWCDYSGIADGQHVGIAVFDHESNPRYPTGWHVRNYGLMTANCFALSHFRPDTGVCGDMTLPKGSTKTWRYRLYIHRGDARTGKVAGRFIDFVSPPDVTLH
jgi:hypothetical protein